MQHAQQLYKHTQHVMYVWYAINENCKHANTAHFTYQFRSRTGTALVHVKRKFLQITIYPTRQMRFF